MRRAGVRASARRARWLLAAIAVGASSSAQPVPQPAEPSPSATPVQADLAGGAAAPAPAALETIVVTTRRLPEDPARVPAAIGVVAREDIQLDRQQLGLDESLVRIPGLFLQNRTNFAQDLRISSRGFGARSGFGIRGLKVFVDGIPATLPDGQTGVDSIDLGSVDRIEVMRGPASSLYGAASGGVIQLVSEDAPDHPFVEARLSLGELGFQRHQLKTGGEAGPVGLLASVSQVRLDGYRDHSRTRTSLFTGKLRYTIDDGSDLSVTVNATHSPRADDPGGLTREQARRDARQASPQNLRFDTGESVDQQKLGLVYRRSFGRRHEIAARNHYVWRDLANRLPFRDGGAVDLERFVVGGGLHYAYAGEVLGWSDRLILGLDVDAQRDRRRRFDNEDGRQGALRFDQDEDVTAVGVYLQNRLDLGAHVELDAGVRYDRVGFRVSDDFPADGDGSGHADFDELSPALALRWSVLPALDVYANLSTSFETPTTTEFADPSGREGLNPDLDAQTATNTEVGVKGRGPGRLRYELALFRVEVEDELVPFERPDQPERRFFRNAGRSTRKGVELAAGVEPWRGLGASLAYTYSDFRFDDYQTPDGVFDGNRIPGIPRHLLFGELAYRHSSGLRITWDALYVDHFDANDANTVRTGAYLVSNLRISHRIRIRGFEIVPFLGVNNLFDRSYYGNVRINASGGRFFEPAPDRNVYGGMSVRYTFGP